MLSKQLSMNTDYATLSITHIKDYKNTFLMKLSGKEKSPDVEKIVDFNWFWTHKEFNLCYRKVIWRGDSKYLWPYLVSLRRKFRFGLTQRFVENITFIFMEFMWSRYIIYVWAKRVFGYNFIVTNLYFFTYLNFCAKIGKYCGQKCQIAIELACQKSSFWHFWSKIGNHYFDRFFHNLFLIFHIFYFFFY